MKKFLALILVLASSLSYADNTENLESPKLVHYHLKFEKIKNNKTEVLHDYSGSNLLKQTTPAASINSKSYLKECTPNPETKKMDISSGIIDSGLNTILTIFETQNTNKYLVKIDIEYRELLGINKLTLGNCTIETPETRSLFFKNSYEVESNKEIVLDEATFTDINLFTKDNEEAKYKLILEITPE